MPIKEIITYGIGIAMTVGLAGNPLHFRENLRNFQLQILREFTRVDNWGNPSPFRHHPEFKILKKHKPN